MVNVITGCSRYLLILLLAVYVYLDFLHFRYAEDEKKKRIFHVQNAILLLVHFVAYVVLYLKTEDEQLVVFYIAQVLFLILYIGFYRLLYRKCARSLLNNLCLFLCIGMIILTRLSYEKAVRQAMLVLAAAVATLVIPLIVDRVWQLARYPWIYGVGGLLLLIYVWLLGNTSFGAQLSLQIGRVVFQPSEFVKITFVFFVATMFYRSTSFRNVLLTTLVAAAHVLILVLSKDLGSALIFFLTYLGMLFVATTNWFYLIAGVVSGSAASVGAYRLFSHVRARVLAWRDPWSDIDDRGYQIAQSLFAIGTGGWFGMGLYQGIPHKIPVVEKDFVFAAIAEELGGLFAICILFLCMSCFLQFMMIAQRMQAMFYKLIAFGLGSVYIIQVCLNAGGVVKFIPSTGVTFPLISYGGSSLFATFVLFQVMQGLYILKQNDEEYYEKTETKSKSK